MPNSPKTPARTVRVSGELWDLARKVAHERDETVADVIRRALRDYVASWPGSSSGD